MRETKRAKSEYEKLEPSDVFSAMPPVESLKALVSHVMTEKVGKRGRVLVLAVFDVSRAHFYGVCVNAMFTWNHLLSYIVLVLWQSSTRRCTERKMRAMRGRNCGGEHLRNNGFELGASNPALYRSELVNGFCHGDDFVTAAAEDQIEVFGKMLQEKFDTRRIGMICAAKHFDKELGVLHRSVWEINDELIEIEADQKHVPRLLEDYGLTQGNIVKPPRVKLSATEADAIESSPILEGEQATLFRSGTMRCACLAQDRAGISETIKCLAQGMSKPRTGHMIQLKRVARYLKGVPRKAQQYPAQEPSRAHLEVHVDSDWAGDTVTRRSTSGVIVRRGRHLLRHSSTVQNVIGLSGAESEYYALTKGGCSGLGLQSLFADWNLKLQLSLHTDSSSAKAIASRRGTGKSTRHIQTRMLWLQERVAAKHLRHQHQILQTC